MKPINFITPLSPAEQKSYRVWLFISLFLASICLLYTIIVTSLQLFTLFTLHKEINSWNIQNSSFTTSMDRKQKLKQQQQTLKDRLAMIHTHKNSIQYTANIIHSLHKIITQHGILDTIAVNFPTIDITLRCQSITTASTISHTIMNIPAIATLTLTSLQPHHTTDKKMFKLILHGTLHGNNVTSN